MADVRYHHGDLRRTLISAGVELLRESNGARLSLREAARRAGVSHTAPYRHFADKSELEVAIATDGFTTLGKLLDETRQDVGPNPLARLFGSCRAYVEFAFEHPAQWRVMFGAPIPDSPATRSAEGKTPVQRVFEDAVRACQEAGYFRSGDASDLAVVVWSSIHGLATLLTSIPHLLEDCSVEDRIVLQCEVLLHGLAPRD